MTFSLFGIVGECVGIERSALQKLVNGTVHAVGAAADGNVNYAPAGTAILDIVGARHHLEFLHRVDGWDVGDIVHAVIDGIVGSAVEEKLVIRASPAVDRPRRNTGIGEGVQVLRARGMNDAGG